MIWRKIFASLALAFAILLTAAPAQAQATRTWVSGVGDDVNPCSRTAPCKTFAGAISKTASGGEISCLDPGGFGGVTITKPVTLNCRGTHGSILVSGGAHGITVNAPNAVVTLRNVSLTGVGSGASAVRVVAGTVIADQVEITSFDTGVDVAAGGTAVITRSSISSSRKAAVAANGAGARVSVGESVLTANASALQASGGGAIVSLGGNAFAGNTADGSFTATSGAR